MAMFQIYAVDEQIKALPTVNTASGSVATFETDMTENLVSVKCQIVAKQASGTPSPVNPLPIQTYDSLTLYHNDINMWDEQWELGAYDVNNGEKYNSSIQIRCKNKIPIQPNTRYFKALSGTGTVYWQIYFDKFGNYLSYNGVTANTNFITPNDAYYMVFYCEQNYGTTYNNDISINYPSTETQYHAFNGAYIPFGQTVANGVLDITTGKLRVTYGVVDLGSLNWIYSTTTTNPRFQTTDITDFKLPTNYFSDDYALSISPIYSDQGSWGVVLGDGSYDNAVVFAPNGAVSIVNHSYTDATTFKNAMSGVSLCYELATPIEIQLDSITLQALLNENNVWCDTGDTTAKYILSVGEALRQS